MLPFIAMGAVGTSPLGLAIMGGIAAKKAYDKYKTNKFNSETNNEFDSEYSSVVVVTPPLTQSEKNDIAFRIILASAAVQSDGVEHSDQINFLLDLIENLTESNPEDGYFWEQIWKITTKPISLKLIKDRYDALTKKSSKDYLKLIDEVIRCNGEIADGERAFRFRCQLLFNSEEDEELCIISHEIGSKKLNALTYIHPNQLNNYTVENPQEGIFYIVLGKDLSNGKVFLEPLKSFYSNNYLSSLSSELVEAARLSGAKSVRISTKKTSNRSQNTSQSAEVKTKIASGNIGTEKLHSLIDSEEKKINHEFKGISSFFTRKILSRSSVDKYLSKTRWIQHDAELVQFVKSSLCDNKSKSFYYEINKSGKFNRLRSIEAAASSELIKISPKAKAEFLSKLDETSDSTEVYEVCF